MVVAKFTMDETRRMASLHVKGHAGANAAGQDLICASASMLAYTLAQTVKIEQARKKLRNKPEIQMQEGDTIITCRAKNDESYAEILHAYLVIQTGYQLLAHNYPAYVAVETFGNEA